MFRRMNSYYKPLRTASILAATLIASASTNLVWGVGLTYVDGDPEFALNVTPQSAFSLSATADQLWGKRVDFGAGVTVWESGGTEDSPEIVQTVSGLTPGTSYDLYAVYWTDNDENWDIQSGLASNTYTSYSWTGTNGTMGIVGSVQGAPAALAQWEPAGLPPAGPAAQGVQLFTERVTNPPTATTFGTDDPLVMMLGKAGTAVADGGGNVQVYMNDVPAPGGSRRAWFDGVAYQPTSAAPLTPTATLNRDTGTITINNPTSVARSIKGIRIESVTLNATGALNGPGWASVASGGNPNWTAIADPTTAVPAGTSPAATPYSSNLVETGTTNITLAANGGTLSLGSVWNKSPFDNFAIHLLLSDDTVALISPQVTGTAITLADLNFNGSTDLADYQALMTNIHTSIAGLTRVESLRKGDMTGDGAVNFNDFAAFRTAYDVAHGAGSFELMAGVPEPGSLALCFIGGAAATCLSRRRRAYSIAAVALATCVLASSTARAVPLLAFDVDDRETAAAGTEAGNTVAGFQSFTLKGTTASVPATPEGDNTITSGTTTRVLGAYTVGIVAFDDGQDENNVTAGVQNTIAALDDRDRTTPVDAGALTYAQIYDDFFFAGASAGPTGGMNVTVSGGTLQPNKGYLVSVYSYDSGSGGTRSANWFDGTNASSPILSTSWAGAAANNPTTNDQYKFTGIGQTDASGVLTLQGRSTSGYVAAGGVNFGVFLNAMEISEFTGLTLEVNTTTGATRVLNEQAGALNLGYYEVRSAAGALNPAGWNSFDDQESGDPVGTGWDEASGSNANILSEGNLQGQSSIAVAGNMSLGNAFTAAGAHDLRFLYAEFGDNSLRPGLVKYVSTGPVGVPGDYNNNGVVDGADYVLWRNGGPLQNEVDNPGTVNAADYTAWRARFGNTSGSGSSLGDGAVPEPASLALVSLALSLAFGLRRGR